MATQKRTTTLLPGSATHTRTAHDYMGILLDAVSPDNWREVVQATVQLAKSGDPQARNWLGQYLIGKPDCAAPTAVNVIVNQLQGKNEVLDKLTHHTFIDAQFHDRNDDVKAGIRAQLETEISHKLQQAETSK